MIRKLTLLAMAVGAVVALMAPEGASATTMKSGGTVIVPPANLRVTSKTTVLDSEAIGRMECEEATLNSVVTKNSGGTVEAEGEGGTTSGCSLEGGSPIQITDFELGNMASSSFGGLAGTGTFSLSFTAHLPGGATCQFASNGQTGVFHFLDGSDILLLTPTDVTGSGACGTSTFEGEVTVERAPPFTAEPVTFHTT